MSEGVVKTVLAAVTEEKKKESGESVEPKDFFWDQFVKYISSAILALTLLNITVEFFRDGGVACFHPPDTVSLLPTGMDALAVYEFARDQAMFINKYCVASIPFTEYFPVYILVHGLLLVSPHYIWGAIYKGDFDSFFSIAGKIDRLRTSSTGEYSEENFDRVKKLEREYGGSTRRIFLSYVGKLFIQLVVCVISICLSAGWLRDFTYSFDCPRELARDGVVPAEWPMNVTVPCVYNTLRVLSVVRVVDFILTGLAAALIVYGIGWCIVRHTQQLGYHQTAKFAFQSCLKPETYVFPPIVRFGGRPFLKHIQRKYDMNVFSKYLLWPCTHRFHSFKLRNCFSPRIRNDLDFLLLTLFRADASHGKVFKNIQVNKELRQLVGRDHQLLHLYINIQQDMMVSETKKAASVRRRNVPSGNGTVEVLEERTDTDGLDYDPPSSDEEGEGGETTGCLAGCLAKCINGICCCCFQKKPQKPARAKNVRVGSRSGDANLHRLIADFRDIFTKSEFNGDPGRIAFAEQTAFAYFKPYLGNLDFQEENLSGMRDMIYWFICQHGKSKPPPNNDSLSNNIAVDVSFGTIGYALVLSRAFKAVYSVNFHPYYRGTGKDVVKQQEFFTNYYILTYPDDIYTRSNHHIVQANQKILTHLVELEKKKKTVDMIMVGPVADESHKVSINLFLNVVNLRKCIGDGALLLAVRPLRIGCEKVSSFKYEPSKKLFMKINQEKLTDEQQKLICRCVDGQKGYKVACGGVSCIFEFEAYEFCGYEPDDDDDTTMSGDDQPEMAPGDSGPDYDAEDTDGSIQPRHIDRNRGGGIRTVAVDIESSPSPPRPTDPLRSRSGDVEAQYPADSGAAAVPATRWTGTTGSADTRSESVSIDSNYSTPPNELASTPASLLGISQARNIMGSESSEPVAGRDGRVNPLNPAPVMNGLSHHVVNGAVSDRSVNSLHGSRTSDLAVNPFSGRTADEAFRRSHTSNPAPLRSLTRVGSDKNAAVSQPPLEQPDNSHHPGQFTSV